MCGFIFIFSSSQRALTDSSKTGFNWFFAPAFALSIRRECFNQSVLFDSKEFGIFMNCGHSRMIHNSD